MEQKKRGRPSKHAKAMTSAERQQEYRDRKRDALIAGKGPRTRWQRQEKDWAERLRDADQAERAIEKTLARHPKIMKEYLTAAIRHKAALKLAIEAAYRGHWSPESIQFVTKVHREIGELSDMLERYIAGMI